MNAIYLDAAMVPAQLRGGYTGKKFKAVIVTQVTIPSDSGLWSGGTRNTFRFVQLSTGDAIAASDNMSAPWDTSRKDQNIALAPGFAVVEHSMFCGKDMGLTFYVHPDNAAKLLPAPAPELNAHESIVLSATCSFKSSYNGQDRYTMAKTKAEYPWRRDDSTPPFPTRDEWSAAKDSLISKGLLNKAGAVTPKGRNARPRH
jgi:hypothetical protein